MVIPLELGTTLAIAGISAILALFFREEICSLYTSILSSWKALSQAWVRHLSARAQAKAALYEAMRADVLPGKIVWLEVALQAMGGQLPEEERCKLTFLLDRARTAANRAYETWGRACCLPSPELRRLSVRELVANQSVYEEVSRQAIAAETEIDRCKAELKRHEIPGYLVREQKHTRE